MIQTPGPQKPTFVRAPQVVGFDPSQKYQTKLKVFAWNKRTTLFVCNIKV
jgi:hypothetical protein